MGLYDRDYIRDEPTSGFSLAAQSMVIKILLVTVALYLVNMFVNNALFEYMALRLDIFARPWNIWQTVTYGFAHDPGNLWHIVGNMYMLWLFGRQIETTYGSKEFLRFYLASLVIAGLAWAITNRLVGVPPGASIIGASGAVSAVVILYALKFPKHTFLLYFAIPVKAWMIGVFYVSADAMGFLGHGDENVGYAAHLGGAAFAFAYAKLGWNLGSVPPFAWIGGMKLPKLGRKAKLRIHQPDEPAEPTALGEEVDRILEKISRQGESSLTSEERRTLSEASRRYQRRRG